MLRVLRDFSVTLEKTIGRQNTKEVRDLGKGKKVVEVGSKKKI